MMQGNSWIDRRALLTGGLGAFASMLLDRGVDLRAEPAPVRVRREVHEPAAAPMLALYKRAIKEMKTRPVWDPTSWWFQANIHLLPPENDSRGCFLAACFDQLFQPPSGAGPEVIARIQAARRLAAGEVPIDPSLGVGRDRMWAKCPHGTLDFLPWHRVYLFFFERIIENVVGEPFAIPYWNYLDSRYRDMPVPFRAALEADGSENPLFYPDRSPLCRDPNDPSVPPTEKPLIRNSDLNWQMAADQTFLERGDVLGLDLGFSFQLESAPHDQIHGRIGIVKDGVPLGMATTLFAARDPIFYFHHANLDRLWEWWRTQAPADGEPNRNPDWIWTFEPYLFATADIRKTGLTAGESLDMVGAMYAYDTIAPLPTAAGDMTLTAAAPKSPMRVGRSAGGLATQGGPASTRLTGEPGAAVAPASPSARWFLRLTGVSAPGALAGVFDIYLDTAASGPAAGPPAGSFAFFGGDQTKLSAHGGHGSAAKPTEKIVEVTARVRELIGQGADPANLRVTVVPNKSTDTANARVGRIELFSR